jgi:DNA repair photolyase
MTPYIISASRREDIPAFRSEWFLERLKEGKVTMSSSFTNYEISFEKVKLIVFWTKNPQPLIEHLDKIPYKYYFQFSLNDYPEYELNIPSLEERIKTFQELSDRIGKHKVIWRFDPIIVNQKLRSDEILSRIENIGDQLHPYTEKLVFSFVDPYKKLKDQFNEIDNDTQVKIAKKLIEFNKKWNLKLGTCAEGLNLEGIEHNKCVDPELVTRICGKQKWITSTKDKTQRELCGCVPSGDIGSFKSCEHKCVYCYAK